jgi:integrase
LRVLVSVLKAAKARRAAQRLVLGGGAFAYVVSNEIGEPYWVATGDTVKAAGVRHIKLDTDASLTMKLYAHSQDDALKAAGDTLNRVLTSRDTDTA